MKIALLNLPFDNNYGGNLQRYALMKVLAGMGHDVTHLYTRGTWSTPWKVAVWRMLSDLKHLHRPVGTLKETNFRKSFDKRCSVVEPFYKRYVKHTHAIHTKEELKDYQSYDAYIVGSDQVWRKSMMWLMSLNTMFFDWVTNKEAKKIAYAVSMGTDENEFSKEDIDELCPLYKQFDAVSVREVSALKTLKDFGWDSPVAVQTLDPTLLLLKEDYLQVIRQGKTKPSNGNMFCYVLDTDESKLKIMDDMAKERGLKPFVLGIEGSNNVSIEQWLRSFVDAEYVVTDSFHGLVFSLIFNKPFKLMVNPRRGMARFESLLSTHEVNIKNPDWNKINNNIVKWQNQSLNFLTNSLK